MLLSALAVDAQYQQPPRKKTKLIHPVHAGAEKLDGEPMAFAFYADSQGCVLFHPHRIATHASLATKWLISPWI